MFKQYTVPAVAVFTAILLFLSLCRNASTREPRLHAAGYERFRDSVKLENQQTPADSNNLFDAGDFVPGEEAVDTFLIRIDTQWHREVWMMEKMEALIREVKKGDTIPRNEIERIRENVRVLDSFLRNKNAPPPAACSLEGCLLFADVVKSRQMLYLYLEGVLKDSFPVSTGMKDYETKSFSVRPSGPLFMKYTSRKFPGGNYKGLGNMPYAVFVLGGYAIHGTTPGNFSKLGTVASHGCIRLHPDNARVFYELVKMIGLRNTWVRVRE